MSDFKAKMHQIRFRLGLRPRPRWGSLQCSPRPLAGFEGPTSKGGEEGEGMRGERREGRGGLSGNVAEEAFCLKSTPAAYGGKDLRKGEFWAWNGTVNVRWRVRVVSTERVEGVWGIGRGSVRACALPSNTTGRSARGARSWPTCACWACTVEVAAPPSPCARSTSTPSTPPTTSRTAVATSPSAVIFTSN